MIRRLSLVLALGAVSVLAACGSNEPPSPDPAIGITAPQDAAAFSDDDDVDPTTDGVQIAVTVSVENFVTTHEVFLSSSGDVGGTQSLPLLGVDDPGEVTFDTVTLAAGTNTLTATLFGNDEDIAVAAITVTLSDDGVTPSIAITTPPNGTTLGADDDLDPAVDGVQVAVEAATQNIAGGTAVSVAVNGSEAATANVDGDGVRFGSVTLVEGQNAVRVATEVDGTAISDEITVTVATGACTVTVSPGPEADACEVVAETPDADPDTDGVQVELTIGSDCADLVVTLDGEQVAAATTADGEATVVVTFAEGENTLEVTASDDGQEGTSGVLAYTTDTVAPSLALDSSFAGVVTPDADVDLDTDGLQIDIFGTSDLPIGAEVALSIDGVAVATTAVAEGGVWTFDDVTFASSGAYLVQASALDECGNSGETEERELRVFVIPPTLAIVAPEDGATWNAGDDSDPEADLIQGTFELAGEFAEGTEARVECRPADAPPGSPFAPVAEGAFGDAGTAAVMATLADNVWLCRGLVESPLRAATAPIRLTVDSMVPAPEIRRPLPGALLASTTVVLSVVVGQVTEGEELAVTYTVGDEDPVTVELVDAGFEADVTVSEGEVTITVDVVDGAGNAGSASVSFTVDITGPSLTPVFPVADAIILEDELTADLLLDARFDVDGVDEASELCVSINGMVPDCVGDLAVGEVTVSGVAVLPGDNTLDARLTDDAGNDAELSFGFTVDVDLPRLVIATPVDGSAVNEADGHEVLLNSDLAEGVDITLWVNDAAFGTMASDDVGSAIFTGVSFVEGPNTLYASATDDRGTGTSLTTNVLLDTVPPELAFASPEEGTIFNAESPDASGAAGFQTTASVTAVDLADGRPVTLDVDCDGELSTHDAFFVGVHRCWAGRRRDVRLERDCGRRDRKRGNGDGHGRRRPGASPHHLAAPDQRPGHHRRLERRAGHPVVPRPLGRRRQRRTDGDDPAGVCGSRRAHRRRDGPAVRIVGLRRRVPPLGRCRDPDGVDL